ncbi:transmembrane protein, putative (macronuclear) [Tetrahymena thermophila SB210]|uniref:Transmembrane protein, putative n=1 Tax=Tetrahymena thermophila (strain SB210) TaxID=312017 RepID=Q244X6_TETTS|nr:transmembrane protein, putative [Tetrahymena thermophila SB210]EAS03361.2 transmembrane protein, putative [Tetrahymena thermophila SB210]|eukprot:XP_001023606.2 transmembrane protein, putative [Tetrahymena thermophila SB210]
MINQEKNQQKNNFFELSDLFGSAVNIRYNKKQNYNTSFGGFVSCSLSVVLILYISNILKIYLSHQQVQVIQELQNVQKLEQFNLTVNTFSFMIAITDINYTSFIDNSIYTLKVTQITQKRILNQTSGQYDLKITHTPINMERCTKEHFLIDGTQSYFLQQDYDHMYCFNKDSVLYLEGDYNQLDYKQLQFEVLECQGTNCKDQQSINHKLNNCYMQVFFTDKNIISTDVKNPLQSYARSNFYIAGTTFTKAINMYMIQTQIQTDEGIIYDDYQSISAITYSNDRESVVSKTTNRIFLLQISLQPNKQLNYIRKYLSLSQMLSQIGGIYNILFAFGCFICRPYAKLQYKRNLMNSVFGFQYINSSDQSNLNLVDQKNLTDIKEKEQSSPFVNSNNQQNATFEKNSSQTDKRLRATTNISQKTSKQSRRNSINLAENEKIEEKAFNCSIKQKKNQSINSIKNTDKNGIKENELIFKKFFQQTFEELRLNTCDYFKYYLSYIICRKKNKSQIIDYGLQKLYNHLDIYYIINKLIEFEKLKKLLLNENQIKLFEYIPKPIISINKANQEIIQTQSNQSDTGILYEDNRTIIQKAEDAQEAYNKIINNPNRQLLDERLISLLHPKLVDLLNENSFDKLQDNQDKIRKLQYRKSIFTPQNKLFNQTLNTLTKFDSQSPNNTYQTEKICQYELDSFQLEQEITSENSSVKNKEDNHNKVNTYQMNFKSILNMKQTQKSQ